ncbi:MAG: hypothetical protein IJ374_08890 [Lachnospiraceae bacterium]|nr:hypothetical protein [Lachnospiraceae bacterium]
MINIGNEADRNREVTGGMYICVPQPGVALLAGAKELSTVAVESFEEEAMEFLTELSDRIREIPRMQASEELKSLGFWLRRPHLLEMKSSQTKNNSRRGLGLSFHIAPSNVPLMFFYSCVMGLLAGNTCLVRLSDRRTETDMELCRLIDEVLSEERFFNMKNRLSFISYNRTRIDLTEYYSTNCDARIIWGGDRTIEAIQNVSIKLTASELVFPDRTSMAVLDAKSVLALSEEELKILAIRFYNDTYSMDQNACSCPKLIFWREPDLETGAYAAERFWAALAEAAERYNLSENKISMKYGYLWECMCFGPEICQIKRWKNRLYVAELAGIPKEEMELGQQFGNFYEYHMKNSDDWAMAVTERTQTLTYFGVSREELRNTVLQKELKGVSRIVPVGQALWMELNWDGNDLISQLSRLQ